MATKKKMLQAAAGVGGAGLDVNEVFSTYIYTGNGSTQTITNGIDLAGEGGLVWTKCRSLAEAHMLFDTERGIHNRVFSSHTNAQSTSTNTLTSFNSNGFSIAGNNIFNTSGSTNVSWSFRKAPKFFDCVTYTGDGVAGRTVSHNLGSVPGCFILKATSTTGDWIVYHRGLSDPSNKALALHHTFAELDNTFFNDTDPTATHFVVGGHGLNINNTGVTYVAYLFAHNDGDGEFGPDADQDIIKCGSYTGDGTDQRIELGFEPQWVMIKNTSSGSTYSDWVIFDNMRKLDASGSGNAPLMANLSDSEGGAYASSSYNLVQPTPTGMIVEGTSGPLAVGTNGDNYIYMAIRRGPLNPPTAATEVFAVGDGSAGASGNAGRYRSGFSVDMGLEKDITGSDNWELVTRLLSGTSLRPNGTNAEDTGVGGAKFDYMDGWNTGTAWADSYSWMWKRAPSYFDCVAYTGSGVAGRTVSHNLGVAPEMMWVKQRPYSSTWRVYHSAIGNVKALTLNDNLASYNLTSAWNSTTPTATEFTLGTSNNVNENGLAHVAYLFSTLAGISKVGSVTHSGTTNVDCGFSSGARFVMLKRTDATGDWYIWDSVRGIVSGNDPYLLLNTTAAQVTNTDYIDPLSSGFTITSNFTAGDYIFYAIA